MKNILIIIMSIISVSAQSQEILDTIFANDKKNVALFFPKPIRQGLTGANHFVFTYNREKEQYFGLLQAKPGQDSNLLTVTNDGEVYSYIIRYSKKLNRLNYFIKSKESIGNEIPKKTEFKPAVVKPINKNNKVAYFNKMSESLLISSFESLAFKRKKGVILQLRKIVYDNSEMYMVIEVINKSGIDFEIDYLKVYKSNGNNKRKASYQKLPQSVIYKHNMPGIVMNKQSRRFVFVLPKFVLGENEKLLLELNEYKGSRKIIMKARN